MVLLYLPLDIASNDPQPRTLKRVDVPQHTNTIFQKKKKKKKKKKTPKSCASHNYPSPLPTTHLRSMQQTNSTKNIQCWKKKKGGFETNQSVLVFDRVVFVFFGVEGKLVCRKRLDKQAPVTQVFHNLEEVCLGLLRGGLLLC